MKIKKNKKMILGSGILLLTLTAGSIMAFGGQDSAKGSGCHGDKNCRVERQAKMKREKGGENFEKMSRQVNAKNDIIKNKKRGDCNLDFDNIKNGEKFSLTEEEKKDIAHMREEEKIARDVYITLYKKWGLRPFNNIKNAEQKHMDMVKILIDKYGLEDSMVDNTVGVFKTKEFQDLYDDLVAKGSKSLVDAIKVGLTIEDLDIYDLDRYLANTKNKDIKNIFEKLNEGSFHHAQAFKRQLDKNDSTYKPQFVSNERWEKILNSNDGHSKKMTNKGYKKMQEDEGYGDKKEESGFFSVIWNFLFGWM